MFSLFHVPGRKSISIGKIVINYGDIVAFGGKLRREGMSYLPVSNNYNFHADLLKNNGISLLGQALKRQAQ